MSAPTAPSNKAPPFGKECLSEFLLDPTWRNLNHGSYGACPRFVQNQKRAYNDLAEARPDFYAYINQPALLAESRAALAEFVNAPAEQLVFVQNATIASNMILRNFTWNPDGKDVIITFSSIYAACGNASAFIGDTNDMVSTVQIPLSYPLDDDEIVQKFRDMVKSVEREGKRARLCIFDIVASSPGVLFPWKDMIKACRELDVVSMVDGAQGIGMVDIDISATDPDILLSNCHKWLFVPRTCTFLYMAPRIHHLVPMSLIIGYNYRPKSKGGPVSPSSSKSWFVDTFQPAGTLDIGPYLCVKDSISYRRDHLGGEGAILKYIWDLNRKGSDLVAKELGTKPLDNSKGTMRNCGMATTPLPIWCPGGASRASKTDFVLETEDDVGKLYSWFEQTMMTEYKTYIRMCIHDDRFWARTSAQIYLELDDFAWAAKVIKELCERASRKEFQKA